jgi:hypothetical protein
LNARRNKNSARIFVNWLLSREGHMAFGQFADVNLMSVLGYKRT